METAFDRAEPSPAGFWIRFVANTIDSVMFLALEFVLGVAAGVVWGVEIAYLPLFKVTVSAFMVVFVVAYFAVLHTLLGQSVGKMIVRVRVTGVDGGALTSGVGILRALAWFLSLLPLGLGFVIAGLRQDRRALHDLIAGTRVVRVA